MYCPKCKGTNVSVQAISEVQRRGCLTVLLYLVLLCIPVLGWIVLFMLIRGRRSETKSIGVCQNCGFRWEIRNSKQQMVVTTRVANTSNQRDMSLIDAYKNTYVNVPEPQNDTNSLLSSIAKWINEDLWNEGFYLVDCYIKIGTNPDNGKDIDISEVLDGLNRKMKILEKYGDCILRLSGRPYSELKEDWAEMEQEAKELVEYITLKAPQKNDENFDFNTEAFERKRDQICETIKKICC